MKRVIAYEVESKVAFSRKKYCPHCGSHCYEVWHEFDPEPQLAWFVRCEECGYENQPRHTRKLALKDWELSEGC